MTGPGGARWIALEGGEGSGKSTQARLLAARIDAVLTREPGGTEAGLRIRQLLLDPELGELDARAEALLMAADRAQHVHRVVIPTLECGRHVVSDRSAMSSLAYQGYGRGLDLDGLRRLSDWASAGRWPDLVILLDVPPDVAARRVAGRRAPLDRMESAGVAFHDRVRAGFHALAADDPQRWVVIDAGRVSVEEVAARVGAACAGLGVGVG